MTSRCELCCTSFINIVLQFNESFARNIALSEISFNHTQAYLPRVLQSRPKVKDMEGCKRRIYCIRNFYCIDNEAVPFFLAVKPWRMFALQRQIVIEIEVDNFEIAKSVKVVKGNRKYPVLSKFLNDKRLAESIHSLKLWSYLTTLDGLKNILNRVQNIRQLFLWMDHKGGTTTEEICQRLNDLPRLCSLHIRTDGVGRQYSCSNAAFLHTRLRFGCISMPSVSLQTLNIPASSYAYKSLNLNILCGCSGKKWTEFTHKCTNLAHLTITRLDFATGDLDSKFLLPPNVISFDLRDLSGHDAWSWMQAPQTMLKRLVLSVGQLTWADMAVQWCENVRNLRLHCSEIHGLVTGLPLTVLELEIYRFGDDVLVRDMCMMTLQRLSIHADYKETMNRQFNDWIVNPKFLSGTYIHCYWYYGVGNPVKKQENRPSKVALTFRRVVADNIIYKKMQF